METDTREKLAAVKLVAMDVDGVLTDGRAYYGSNGEQGVFFNVHDGSGIKYLHRAGIRTAIISGRELEAISARAEVLGIELVFQGAKVKMEAYEELKRRAGLSDADICYVGDDLTDVPVMRAVGLAIAVANARDEVRELADIVTRAAGGDGAVREVSEMVLKASGKWDDILKRYYD